MRYYSTKLDKKQYKEVESTLSPLDKRILGIAEGGANISLILAKSKVFTNVLGSKEYHSGLEVGESVKKLMRKGLIVRR